ncbi:GGDEF domain-containing protein [Cellvibrio sp. PSBB023]|uniref:GGDEF domain-containing protein n=1 Tax=Cellvibrio sp. PSBB023 TaxID=1945512 RepID=UPI00143B4B24|nr:GGDEF domain-containing protein [Cellvibrio sp. PSBB023]
MSIQQDIVKARLLGLCIVITVLLLALQKYGPEKVLIIGKDAGLEMNSLDDSGNGGASIASLVHDGDTLLLNCEIIASAYRWPYCVASFKLTDASGKGMDLSGYRQITVAARYSTPQDVGIRIQLINFNPAYANDRDSNSLKYNALELFDAYQTISLSHMQVPTWWLILGKIRPEYAGPEFTDIRGIQVATGEHIKPGKYQIIIDGVELRGKYLSDNQLYLFLLAGWTLMALLFFVSTLRKAKRELRTHQQRQQQLEALNSLLNKQQQTLEARLARDPLTGVLNRDGIAPVFEHAWDSHNHQQLSLIFIDIDNFKKINDDHGHNRGDEVLRLFAQVLVENTRAQDFLARWGGEEFVLACPDTNVKNATALAEKLRLAIQHTSWPQGLSITASFGVAQMHAHESPTDFIARADQALYEAKAQGRNGVRYAP